MQCLKRMQKLDVKALAFSNCVKRVTSFCFLPEDASSQFLSHSPDINDEGSSSNSKAACLQKEKNRNENESSFMTSFVLLNSIKESEFLFLIVRNNFFTDHFLISSNLMLRIN